MCHPYVAGDEASRPVIKEVLTYLDEMETMMTRDEEIPTPKFAVHRVHDILFVIGGMVSIWRPAVYFETYCPRSDRWTKVSGTHLLSYSALLSNYKPCHGSGR
jgi:kelch-like protein 10